MGVDEGNTCWARVLASNFAYAPVAGKLANGRRTMLWIRGFGDKEEGVLNFRLCLSEIRNTT
jgi:hypothetical protein